MNYPHDNKKLDFLIKTMGPDEIFKCENQLKELKISIKNNIKAQDNTNFQNIITELNNSIANNQNSFKEMRKNLLLKIKNNRISEKETTAQISELLNDNLKINNNNIKIFTDFFENTTKTLAETNTSLFQKIRLTYTETLATLDQQLNNVLVQIKTNQQFLNDFTNITKELILNNREQIERLNNLHNLFESFTKYIMIGGFSTISLVTGIYLWKSYDFTSKIIPWAPKLFNFLNKIFLSQKQTSNIQLFIKNNSLFDFIKNNHLI